MTDARSTIAPARDSSAVGTALDSSAIGTPVVAVPSLDGNAWFALMCNLGADPTPRRARSR